MLSSSQPHVLSGKLVERDRESRKAGVKEPQGNKIFWAGCFPWRTGTQEEWRVGERLTRFFETAFSQRITFRFDHQGDFSGLADRPAVISGSLIVR